MEIKNKKQCKEALARYEEIKHLNGDKEKLELVKAISEYENNRFFVFPNSKKEQKYLNAIEKSAAFVKSLPDEVKVGKEWESYFNTLTRMGLRDLLK